MQIPIRPLPESHDLVVGIVGCGVMGRGIAQIAVLAGARVLLADSRAAAAATARDTLLSTFAKLVEKGKLDGTLAAAAAERLIACSTLADLAGSNVIVEAIVEDLGAKKELFAELESLVSSDVILATNTSSLSVTSIAADLRYPHRVVGFHFFNPVPLMKIVETIGGLLTDPDITDYMIALGKHWGHTTVRAKDTPGFIVNHAGRGFGTEGMRVLSEGVTTIPALDQILRDTAGFKLGPCELMDMTGLDVSHPVMESIYHQYYEEPRFRPQGLTRQMLVAGLLGRKVGHGFYRYGDDGKKMLDPEVSLATAMPTSVWLSRARPELADRVAPLIMALANQVGATFETDATPSAGALCIVTPLGDDATTCTVAEGLDAQRTVAIEALFDTTRRRIIMTSPATSPEACAAACGLFTADGAQVTVIRDSAGLVTQRVVAHIINIACEIAQQRIADPLDIDRAVLLGLGYPHGPLAWGDQIGAATVVRILNNLLQQTGDPRYRASAWLQRRAALKLSLLHTES